MHTLLRSSILSLVAIILLSFTAANLRAQTVQLIYSGETYGQVFTSPLIWAAWPGQGTSSPRKMHGLC